MDIVVKKLPKSMVEMTITLSWDEWSKNLSEAVGHISKEVRVEGFRKGKAPRRMIEQNGGPGMVLAEAQACGGVVAIDDDRIELQLFT